MWCYVTRQNGAKFYFQLEKIEADTDLTRILVKKKRRNHLRVIQRLCVQKKGTPLTLWRARNSNLNKLNWTKNYWNEIFLSPNLEQSRDKVDFTMCLCTFATIFIDIGRVAQFIPLLILCPMAKSILIYIMVFNLSNKAFRYEIMDTMELVEPGFYLVSGFNQLELVPRSTTNRFVIIEKILEPLK